MSEIFNRKIKSFGMLEAIIASGIVAIVLSGVVALSSSSLRSATLNNSYFEAEQIAGDLMEKIYEAKSAGKLYFDDASRENDALFLIDCFDTDKRASTAGNCLLSSSFRSEVPYRSNTVISPSDGYVQIGRNEISPSFPEAFFSWKIKINKPEEMNDLGSTLNSCRSLSGTTQIPKEKCRFAEIDVKWQESSGEKHYYLTQYFSDWER